MAENNTAVATQQKSPKAIAVSNFQKVLNNSYYQNLLQETLKENRGTFVTSLMELFTSDEKLQQCQPVDLMAEALKAASLRLPLNKQLSQCFILPFKNKGKMTPTLVIGTRGYLQLAMRTGKYETINADVVYEGELQGYDKVTGKLDLNGTRKSSIPVGYFAYMKKKDGFSKLLYMSLDEVCAYAKRYSPTVKYSNNVTAESLKSMAINQAQNGSGDGVGWYSNFESMAIKTCLRQLLSKWGELSIESNNILSMDEAPSAITQRDAEFSEAKEVVEVEPENVGAEGTGTDTPHAVDATPTSEPYSLED